MRLRDLLGTKPVDVFADWQTREASETPTQKSPVTDGDVWVWDARLMVHVNRLTGESRCG